MGSFLVFYQQKPDQFRPANTRISTIADRANTGIRLAETKR
jgi:hypothetical protein